MPLRVSIRTCTREEGSCIETNAFGDPSRKLVRQSSHHTSSTQQACLTISKRCLIRDERGKEDDRDMMIQMMIAYWQLQSTVILGLGVQHPKFAI